MGLFGKSKKNNEYNGYQSSKGRNVPKFTSFDNMVYVIVRDISDDQTIEICDLILGGKPVLANFSKIPPSMVNEMLAFISGVVYATGGRIEKIEAKSFLFARKEEYLDGSLEQYIEDTK